MAAILYPHLSAEPVEGITIVRFLDREVWEVHGEGGNGRALADELRGLVEDGGATRLVLDLGNVEFLCGAMLGEFLRLKRRVEQLQGRLILSGLTAPRVREIFRITRLDRHFEIVDSPLIGDCRILGSPASVQG